MEKKSVEKQLELPQTSNLMATNYSSMFSDQIPTNFPSFPNTFDNIPTTGAPPSGDPLSFLDILTFQDYSFSTLYDMLPPPSLPPPPPPPATLLPPPPPPPEISVSDQVVMTPVTPNSSSFSSTSSELALNDDQKKPGEGDDGADGDDDQNKTKKQLKPKKKTQKRQKEPRFAFMTKSEVDHLDDGFRWRKYGQKAVKNSPFPRSYYRCTTPACGVKKRVERSNTDPDTVMTTYEGTHTHPLPMTGRGSSLGLISMPEMMNNNNAPPPGFNSGGNGGGISSSGGGRFFMPPMGGPYGPPQQFQNQGFYQDQATMPPPPMNYSYILNSPSTPSTTSGTSSSLSFAQLMASSPPSSYMMDNALLEDMLPMEMKDLKKD